MLGQNRIYRNGIRYQHVIFAYFILNEKIQIEIFLENEKPDYFFIVSITHLKAAMKENGMKMGGVAIYSETNL